MSIDKYLEKLQEHAEELIIEAGKKEKLTAQDLEIAEKAVCMNNAIQQLKRADMMMDREYSGNSYHTPYMHEASYMRGRDPETGRYMSRDVGTNTGGNMSNRFYDNGYSSRRYYDGGNMNNGYSGHSRREGMIETLNEMMANAQNEQERQYVQKWLNRVDQNY